MAFLEQHILSHTGGAQNTSSCFSRTSCAITDVENNRVIITGGGFFGSDKLVSMYNEEGFIGDLAMLKNSRQRHACTSYVSNDGSTVDILLKRNKHYCVGCLRLGKILLKHNWANLVLLKVFLDATYSSEETPFPSCQELSKTV